MSLTDAHWLNIRLSPAEIAFILQDAGVSILFLDKDFLPLIGAIQAQLPQGIRVFLLEGVESAPPGLDSRSYEQLLADPGHVEDVLLAGAVRAREISVPFLAEIRERVGVRALA